MEISKPKEYFFKDDGHIPNSKLPFLLHENVFSKRGKDGAAWLETTFAKNNWTNSWRNGIFTYHHYHSITHEVLGVYSGEALVQLGGEKGSKLKIKAGDVIIIPAGVGHKNLECSVDFAVVGAYPNGKEYDILRGNASERPKADENIALVSIPEYDPIFGESEGLTKIWK